MPELLDLWLPILLSGVGVFIVSSIIHMATPMHKGDYARLPKEDAVLDALRSLGVKPGQYAFPHAASMKDMGSPEMIQKYERGPLGWLNVLPTGVPNIGKSLIFWFLYSLLVGVITAYVASLAVPKGADGSLVFRLTSTVALAGYAIGVLNDSIWKGMPLRVTLRFVFDGLLYALTTGALFCWLWPAA